MIQEDGLESYGCLVCLYHIVGFVMQREWSYKGLVIVGF